MADARGRQLEVRVQWEGQHAEPISWVPFRQLNGTLRRWIRAREAVMRKRAREAEEAALPARRKSPRVAGELPERGL